MTSSSVSSSDEEDAESPDDFDDEVSDSSEENTSLCCAMFLSLSMEKPDSLRREEVKVLALMSLLALKSLAVVVCCRVTRNFDWMTLVTLKYSQRERATRRPCIKSEMGME